jgi:hypothetical protein
MRCLIPTNRGQTRGRRVGFNISSASAQICPRLAKLCFSFSEFDCFPDPLNDTLHPSFHVFLCMLPKLVRISFTKILHVFIFFGFLSILSDNQISIFHQKLFYDVGGYSVNPSYPLTSILFSLCVCACVYICRIKGKGKVIPLQA